MSDILTQPVNLKQNIPTFLPLAEAVQKLGLSRKVLTRLIEAGKIEAVQLPSGEVLVSAESNGHEPKTKQGIIAERFAHLQGKTIKVTDAAKRYELNRRTILRWKASGYIGEIEPDSYPVQLDEADVAYCAYVYRQRQAVGGAVIGSRLFDDDGNPYTIKYPDLAENRRKQTE
jgi:predicted site-specific integrase-resolvase